MGGAGYFEVNKLDIIKSGTIKEVVSYYINECLSKRSDLDLEQTTEFLTKMVDNISEQIKSLAPTIQESDHTESTTGTPFTTAPTDNTYVRD